MSAGFLEEMAAGSLERVRAARRQRPQAALEQAARASAPPPRLRLDPAGFDLIAELKLRSPAAGLLKSAGEDLPARVRAYAAAGAAAISVLTEPSRFDGTLEHLQSAAHALTAAGVPAMRKDFLVDPYQVLEARAAGAGGVLIILRMLSGTQLSQLLDCAGAHGLFALLEAFDERDIERMHELVAARHDQQQLLCGVNCRDLATLAVMPQRLRELAPLLPRSVPRVAESGVASAADAREAVSAGYAVALVGSALMRAADPAQLAGELLGAGRAAARGS
jgi:indole-3-glycerol phosphate synthase